MPIGPVEYIIVGFPGNEFNGEIAPELIALVEAGTVRILDLIFVGKDVDGLTPLSAGLLALGRPGLRPCTPSGVMLLLESEGVELEGAVEQVSPRDRRRVALHVVRDDTEARGGARRDRSRAAEDVENLRSGRRGFIESIVDEALEEAALHAHVPDRLHRTR